MNLSQEDIDALMSGAPVETEPSPSPAESSILNEYKDLLDPGHGELTPVEIDTLGEIGNISMGAGATTMYTLLDRRVEITTPIVSVYTAADVLALYQIPYVVVEVEYTEGLIGKNLLLLAEADAALITDVLMGGDGEIEEPIVLTELHMSAMNEIMNQMIGASATALSQIVRIPVNISTPTSQRIALESDTSGLLDEDELLIVVTFDMSIEGLLNSKIIQIMPYTQGRQLSALLADLYTSGAEAAAQTPAQSAPEPAPAPAPEPAPAPQPAYAPEPMQTAPPQYEQPQFPAQYAEYDVVTPPSPGELVDVRPMQFESFDDDDEGDDGNHQQNGIGLVCNIPLTVSAELGTATKTLGDVLDFKEGDVIVLEKTAGDPVAIMVNGKKIARGEVIVIEDSYGVRITDLSR